MRIEAVRGGLKMAAVGAVMVVGMVGASARANAATVKFLHWANTGWYSSTDASQPGMTAFARSVVTELQAIGQRSVGYDISQPYSGDYTGCFAPDICIYMTDLLVSNKGGETTCKSNPQSGSNYSTIYARTIKNMAWELDDGQYFGPSYGQLMKNAVLHEIGHQVGICTDYSGTGWIMSGTLDMTNTQWKSADKDAIYRWYNPPTTGICSGSCPGPGTPPSSGVTIPPNPDALMCDGASNGWTACRGSGCYACREKIAPYPLYLINHPYCQPNDSCGGQFYTCSNNCPPPTSADLCDGTPGTWSGCRGTGCYVCSELVAGYSKYFSHHPACVPNGECGGSYGTCNQNCPSPTEADR